MTDKDLISKYLEGDESALELLIGRYLKPIYSFAYRLVGNSQDAEDISQEVFLKVWKNLKKYNDTKSFKTWIFTITKNTAYDFLRKKKEIVFSDFENDDGENNLEDSPVSLEILPELALIKGEDVAILEEAIKKLPPDYRTVLFLKETGELTFEEIGEIINKPMNTVKSHYRRAILSLRKWFSK
ncbi:MAG: RNA polymerase, sigma-24 subunit, ECF subfamily [Parcubacteria group bacterium GW2011_GWF2_38_76]|nr:MAG: RNA polymerase, sigma-24 subunit, ECF subfamily [Parcubacteria group bacterium GW2011_GWF2_38_76]HBM46217.1 hypothetical protein [Patescibacteria group bacterium]